ncbi:MAG: hypothetical protein AAFO79_01515 [Pseudomonadota bacterium]
MEFDKILLERISVKFVVNFDWLSVCNRHNHRYFTLQRSGKRRNHIRVRSNDRTAAKLKSITAVRLKPPVTLIDRSLILISEALLRIKESYPEPLIIIAVALHSLIGLSSPAL